MEDGDLLAEARLETTDGLRGQADFGDQDDRRATGGKCPFDHGQVDLGLAGAGHPGKQVLASAVPFHRGVQAIHRGLLVRGQRRRLDRGRADRIRSPDGA